MSRSFSFTSESVSEGHPDKVADQISDAILDAILAADVKGRVACETLVKTGVVIVAGEVTTSAWVDVEAIVRKTVLDIGYDHSDMGFDGASCGVLNIIGKQSPDIAQGVDRKDERKQGAGDQGLMFGYATDETDVLMPAPITLAHRLVKRQAQVRKSGKLPWLRPDAKSQVTLRYENDKPVGLEAVVLSTQHEDSISTKQLREAVVEEILKPVLPAKWIDKHTKYHINPTGRFVIGGPVGDCGLTGRKIIVDTYGGFARHGGGAFSGKDPSKVDRSAAYAARYVAKNIVAAGLAERCEVQVSYAIGVAEPTSIMVETFGTGKLPDTRLTQLVRAHFDLTPFGLREMLDLARPIYQKTASYGHFGRKEAEFTLGTHRQGQTLSPPNSRRRAPAERARHSHDAIQGAIDERSNRKLTVRFSRQGSGPRRMGAQGNHDRRDRDAGSDGHSPGICARAAAARRENHRLIAHDDPDRGADRDLERAWARRCAGPRATSIRPRIMPRRRSRRAARRSSRSKARRLSEYWDYTHRIFEWPDGGHANMILDDGGDATLLLHLGARAEKDASLHRRTRQRRGAVPVRRDQGQAQGRSQWYSPGSPRSRALPRRPPPASSACITWQGRRAGVPGDQRQRFGHQIQVR